MEPKIGQSHYSDGVVIASALYHIVLANAEMRPRPNV